MKIELTVVVVVLVAVVSKDFHKKSITISPEELGMPSHTSASTKSCTSVMIHLMDYFQTT